MDGGRRGAATRGPSPRIVGRRYDAWSRPPVAPEPDFTDPDAGTRAGRDIRDLAHVSSEIPPRLLAGLESAVEQSLSDPAAEDSIRRLLRAIRDSDEVGPVIGAWIDEALAAPSEALADSARAVLAAARPGAPGTPSDIALLVEPDEETSTTAAALLRDAGYRVVTLRDGASTLAAVEQQDVALLVLDVFLPDRDGRDVILELARSGLPIIVLSPVHAGSALARTECIALGASAFLHRREVAQRLPEEIEQLRTRPGGDESIVPRGRFADLFAARDDRATDEVLALLAFSAFRTVSDTSGPDVAERALGAVVDAIGRGFGSEVRAGRWSTDQIVFLLPGDESGAASVVQRALAERADDPRLDEAERSLARSASGAIVTAPPGVRLDDRLQEAGNVRLGLSNRGTRLVSDTSTTPTRPRVMFVEDDRVTSHLVVHKLESAGFEVDAYDNGDRAAEALDGDLDFDVAVFDINLPGQNGFQLVRKLRSVETGWRRPILILSGLEGDEELVRGLELGADDYVLKPFSPVELTARIRRLITAGRRAGGA